MTLPLVVVTRVPPGGALDRIARSARLRLWAGDDAIPHDVLAEWVSDADGLYSMLTDPIDRSLIARSASLRIISQMAVGVDNIDLDAAADHGVAVGHTPEVLTESTADLAIALLLAAARRLGEGVDHVRSGAWGPWQPDLLLGHDVHGSTLGIIGMGRIGSAVARRAAAFAMNILYAGPSPKPEAERDFGAEHRSLDALVSEADHVVVTAPLTADTRHLIDSETLRAMKPTATLINVSRGPLVNTDALVRALSEGWIAAAGLDVTDPEPIPADHPLVLLPNCFIVPHVGSATVRTREAMADLAADNLLAGLRSEPLPAQAGV